MGNTLKQRAFEIHRKRVNVNQSFNFTGGSEISNDDNRSKIIAVLKTNTGGAS